MANHARVAWPAAALIGAAALLAGCGHGKLSHDARAAIPSVSVSPYVALPDNFRTYDENQFGAFFLFGVLALPFVVSNAGAEAENFKAFMSRNAIDVGEIARSEFVVLLESTHAFPKVVGSEGVAQFEIVVSHYGLVPDLDFSVGADKSLRSAMGLEVYLRTKDGELLWEGTGTSSELPRGYMGGDTRDPFRIAEAYADPWRTQLEFRKAARIAATAALRKMGVPIPVEALAVPYAGPPKPQKQNLPAQAPAAR